MRVISALVKVKILNGTRLASAQTQRDTHRRCPNTTVAYVRPNRSGAVAVRGGIAVISRGKKRSLSSTSRRCRTFAHLRYGLAAPPRLARTDSVEHRLTFTPETWHYGICCSLGQSRRAYQFPIVLRLLAIGLFMMSDGCSLALCPETIGPELKVTMGPSKRGGVATMTRSVHE